MARRRGDPTTGREHAINLLHRRRYRRRQGSTGESQNAGIASRARLRLILFDQLLNVAPELESLAPVEFNEAPDVLLSFVKLDRRVVELLHPPAGAVEVKMLPKGRVFVFKAKLEQTPKLPTHCGHPSGRRHEELSVTCDVEFLCSSGPLSVPGLLQQLGSNHRPDVMPGVLDSNPEVISDLPNRARLRGGTLQDAQSPALDQQFHRCRGKGGKSTQ